MTDLFDVLADPTRRAILELLRDHHSNGDGLKVGDIVTALEVSQPTVSKHLKVLREAGLVASRDEGSSRWYHLETQPLVALDEWLDTFVDADEGHAARRSAAAPAAGATPDSSAVDAAATVYSAWAGADIGTRVGRAAADTAYTARVALEAAGERIQGAGRSLVRRLPRFGRR